MITKKKYYPIFSKKKEGSMSLKRKRNNNNKKASSSSREALESLLYEASPMCGDMCNEVMDYVWPRVMTGELLARHKLKDGSFCTSSRLAMDPARGNLYITNMYDHSVSMFSEDGKLLHQWGEKGKGNGTFDTPIGIAVYAQEVFVVDSENQQIQVFSTEGVFLRQWSTQAMGLTPTEIVIDQTTQRVYVMNFSRKIHAFTLKGHSIYPLSKHIADRHWHDLCTSDSCLFSLSHHSIRTMSPKNKHFMHLKCDEAISFVMEGDEIFVITRKPCCCVQVYSKTKKGRLLREIGKGVLNCPFSLAWYRGKLYVFDAVLKSIFIFV